MTTYGRITRYLSNSLLAWLGTAVLYPSLAAAQVVRPDPAEVVAVERANETLSPTRAVLIAAAETHFVSCKIGEA
ncbi:MAG: hypothetical protein ACYC3X_05410 [Pirellulaceae bacterium]